MTVSIRVLPQNSNVAQSACSDIYVICRRAWTMYSPWSRRQLELICCIWRPSFVKQQHSLLVSNRLRPQQRWSIEILSRIILSSEGPQHNCVSLLNASVEAIDHNTADMSESSSPRPYTLIKLYSRLPQHWAFDTFLLTTVDWQHSLSLVL